MLEGMRAVVCVKHVPDGQSSRRIEEGRIVRGEDDTLNELDEFAIEAAVSLVEEHGGEVIALTMGPEDASDALLRALQMGADRAIHIVDDQLAGSDALQTADVLAAAIKTIEFQDAQPVDVVFLGMASLDGMTSLVPSAVATRLQWPYLSLASQLELTGDNARTVQITREADGWTDTLEAPLPAVVSVTDQLNEPRYPSFKSLKAARSKPLDEWGWADLTVAAGQLGIEDIGPRGTIVDAEMVDRSAPGHVIEDTGDAGEQLAQFIFDYLK